MANPFVRARELQQQRAATIRTERVTDVPAATDAQQRMIGNNAGLPPGSGDIASKNEVIPVMRKHGAIPLRGESPSDYNRTGLTVRIRGFERHPVVHACIRAIVDVASSIPLQAYRKRKGPDGREDVDLLPETHALQQIVDRPSPFLSAKRWRKFALTHFVTYGNANNFIERVNFTSVEEQQGLPRELRVVHPEDILTVWVNEKGYPLYYLWRDLLGYVHTSPVTDMVHMRDLNARGMVFGFPRAASALNEIIGDDEASQHVRQVVTNAGSPPAFALLHEDATQEDAEIAEAKLYEKLVTRGQRGKFIFLGVKDVKSVGFSLSDLEFPDLRRVSREGICAAFGVDPRMIGITSASRDAGLSGTQYSEARRRLIQQTIEPLLNDMADELNFWLAPEFGDVWLRYDPDVMKAMVEDDDATSSRVQAEVRANLRTIEEGRVAIGQPAEFEPEDTLLMGATSLVPVSLALDHGDTSTTAKIAGAQATIDNGGVAPSLDGSTPKQLPSGNTKKSEPAAAADAAPAAAAAPAADATLGLPTLDVRKRVALIPPPLRSVHARGVMLNDEQRVLLWRAFDSLATREESAYRRTAMLLFAEERAAVARTFARQSEQAQAARAEPQRDNADAVYVANARRQLRQLYKEGGDVEQRWRDRFHSLIGETFAKGAQHVADSLRANRAGPKPKPKTGQSVATPAMYDFHLHDANAQRAVADRAARLAQMVGRTTGETITDAITVGLRDGMSISQIAKLVDMAAFGGTAAYRSEMIARTETIGALNHGQFYAADESGIVEGKEWLTQGDDRVRDSHAECEAAGAIEMESPFVNGLQYPGDPSGDAEDVINCRCTLLYYDSLADTERAARAVRPAAPSAPATRVQTRYNPNHDPSTGEFTDGPGTSSKPMQSFNGSKSDGLKEHAKLARAAKKAARTATTPGNGFTLHDSLSPETAKGYYVSVAGHELQVPASEFTDGAVLQYRDRNLGILRNDETLRIGGWHNPEDGRVYLDLSKRFDTKEAAIEFGKKHRQIAGFDAHKGETFDIGGRAAQSPHQLDAEQEAERIRAMFATPIKVETLRTAPTTADAQKAKAETDDEGKGETGDVAKSKRSRARRGAAFHVERAVNERGELIGATVVELNVPRPEDDEDAT